MNAIVIASHRRSGTHLTIDLLRRQFAECRGYKWPGSGPYALYLNLDLLNVPGKKKSRSTAQAKRTLKRAKRPLVKTHRSADAFEARTGEADCREIGMDGASIIYVVRDVRKVMCSLHAFAQVFDERAKVPFPQFIRQESKEGLNRIAEWRRHVESWRKRDDVMVVRFEDLVEKTANELDRFAAFLGREPLMRKPLLPRPWKSTTASRLAGRIGINASATTIIGRSKGMGLARWKDVASSGDDDFILAEVGDLLLDLGYETHPRQPGAVPQPPNSES